MSHITQNPKCDYYLCRERYPITLKSLGKYYLFQDFTSASREASWDNWVVGFCLEMWILAYVVLISPYQNKEMSRGRRSGAVQDITSISANSVVLFVCHVNRREGNSSNWRITWIFTFAYQKVVMVEPGFRPTSSPLSAPWVSSWKRGALNTLAILWFTYQ